MARFICAWRIEIDADSLDEARQAHDRALETIDDVRFSVTVLGGNDQWMLASRSGEQAGAAPPRAAGGPGQPVDPICTCGHPESWHDGGWNGRMCRCPDPADTCVRFVLDREATVETLRELMN